MRLFVGRPLSLQEIDEDELEALKADAGVTNLINLVFYVYIYMCVCVCVYVYKNSPISSHGMPCTCEAACVRFCYSGTTARNLETVCACDVASPVFCVF
jgi:hypothetical protein